MLTNYSHVLFDFDGTLADSSLSIYKAFFASCLQHEQECPPYEDFRRQIGPPIDEIYSHFFPQLSRQNISELTSLFRYNYDQTFYKDTIFYDGVLEFLSTNKGAVHSELSIVTNKPTQITRRILEHFSVLESFSFVVGRDYRSLTTNSKPFSSKSHAISYLISTAQINLAEVIYVGDTLSDYQACAGSGIPFVAATYGFYDWSPQDLADKEHIDSVSDLLRLLR